MQDSIYHSVPQSFYREYVKVITDKNKTAPEILSTYRERSKITKKFATVTVQQFTNDPDLCMELVHDLRARMEPESPKFPYPNYKKERAEELITSLAAMYDGHIVVEDAKADIAIGSWPPNRNTEEARYNAQIFNYRVEVVFIPFVDTDRRNLILANINSVPGLNDGESYFEGGNYYVETKDMVYPSGVSGVRSIRDILSRCGFSNIGGGWKKRPCLVYIDLITPCPNWQGSAGKTHIDLIPYQETIGLLVSRLANKMPSVRLNPGSSFRYNTGSGRTGQYMDDYLKPFLKRRRAAIKADPTLKIRDRLTQSGVWYRIEPLMRADGFEPEVDWATTRRSLQGRIAEAIKDLWGDKVTREDLGIVAKARAVLYFNGERHLITSDSIKELAETRTSHLINIEKEGVTDVLLDLAKPHRIALVATAGQPVRYAKDLAKACKDNRIRVCTIYDDDLIGRESADAFKKLGLNVPRLGVDMNTVKWLQQNGYPDLKLTDVLEDYSPQNRQIWKYDEYLKNQKIEIDMIIAKVGAEALWKWILYKLTETFPEQINYIDIVDEPRPEEYFPKELQDLQDYLEDLCELSYSNRWEEIQHNDLEAVDPKDGLMNVEDKNEEIFNELDNVVKEDQHVKDVSKSIKGLLDSLPSIADLKKKYDAMKEDR